LATVLLSVVLVACGGGATVGKYYKYSGETKGTAFIEILAGGKWTDESGGEGTYKLDGEKITFSAPVLGELGSGTYKDGVLTITLLGVAGVYKIDA
jgi:hypothetical protein